MRELGLSREELSALDEVSSPGTLLRDLCTPGEVQTIEELVSALEAEEARGEGLECEEDDGESGGDAADAPLPGGGRRQRGEESARRARARVNRSQEAGAEEPSRPPQARSEAAPAEVCHEEAPGLAAAAVRWADLPVRNVGALKFVDEQGARLGELHYVGETGIKATCSRHMPKCICWLTRTLFGLQRAEDDLVRWLAEAVASDSGPQQHAASAAALKVSYGMKPKARHM